MTTEVTGSQRKNIDLQNPKLVTDRELSEKPKGEEEGRMTLPL